VFMCVDLTHRIPKRRAIEKTREIERFLRDGGQYDGPRIVDSLGDRRSVAEHYWEVWRMMKHGPYIPLFIAILLVASFAT